MPRRRSPSPALVARSVVRAGALGSGLVLVAGTLLMAGSPAPASAARAQPPQLSRTSPPRGSTTTSTPAALTPAPASYVAARARSGSGTPLAVKITSLAPVEVPRTGKIRVTGTLTNRDDQVWTAVNLQSFVSQEPITTTTALAEAAATPASEPVGLRITTPGSFDTVDRIAPGQTVAFHLAVPHASLHADTPGVYWFGVHALGQDREGRDPGVDGLARTFLPLVTSGTRPVPTTIAVPLRREVAFAADGSLSDVGGWTSSLRPGGRLGSLVALGAAAQGHPVSWLVDPAVLDAVRRLADGNPPRSVADTLRRGESKPSAGASPSGPPTPAPTPADPVPTQTSSAPADPGTSSADPEVRAAARVASAWLGRLRAAVAGQEVLALPYGDLDVAAAAQHDPRLYTRARAMSRGALGFLDIPVQPVVGSPSGFLDAGAITSLPDHTTVLATDQLFGKDPPAVANVAGHRVVVTSSGAASGGTGPGDPLAQVGLRQRILSEAAIRALSRGHDPLVVMLPGTWTPHGGPGFWRGLEAAPWLTLAPVRDLGTHTAQPVSVQQLAYPSAQNHDELHAPAFAAVDSLIRAGRTLEGILPRNDTIASEVLAQSLASASYADRSHPRVTRGAVAASRSWLGSRLGAVQIRGPMSVTLSGGRGRFGATVANDLDVPVRVTVEGVSDRSLTIDQDTLDVAPHSHQSILLDARAEDPGVHQVQLVLADGSGRHFSTSPSFPLRAGQVSRVIWLFLIGGLTLLFGAAGVRLVRRVRAAARERGAPTGAGAAVPQRSQPLRPS